MTNRTIIMKNIFTKLTLTFLIAALSTCLVAQNTNTDALYWKYLGDVKYLKIGSIMDKQKTKEITKDMPNQATL